MNNAPRMMKLSLARKAAQQCVQPTGLASLANCSSLRLVHRCLVSYALITSPAANANRWVALMEIENARIKIVYSVVGDCVMLKQFNKEKSGKWRPWNTVLLPREFIRHLTPLALDGATLPDNQQVLPADVLVGEGTLPEPPRQ